MPKWDISVGTAYETSGRKAHTCSPKWDISVGTAYENFFFQ